MRLPETIEGKPVDLTDPIQWNFGRILDYAASIWPDKTALIDPEEKCQLTYRELQDQVHAASAWLRDLGIQPGNKVAITAGNSIAALKLLAGSSYGGIVPVPCNPDLGTESLAYILDHCDATHVFTSHEYLPIVMDALKIISRPLELKVVERQLHIPGGSKIFEPCNPESESLIVYTSGTTGRPKGVVQTNASSFASITATLETFDLTEEDRFLCVLPIHHANSFNKVFATWLAGGMLVLPSRFRVNDFWKWVDAHQCTWLAIVPSIISQLLRFSEPGKHPSVRFARSSSAPLPDAWHKEFEEKFGISMIQGMGSTETGPLFSNPLPPHQPRIGSTGKSVVRQEVKIVDAEGNFLGDYETGNIVARGPSRMKEYYKDNDATTSILTDDGWIQTGDIGYRDSDGYFFVTGRAKEIVIKSGVNIALREIDEALLSHQNVVDAAAAGIEDMILGEDVVAYVVTAPGKAFDETEFLDYCLRKLGSFKAPSEIIQVSEIPRSSSGKIRRFLLKDKFGPEPRKSNNTEAAKKRRRHLYTAPRTPIEKLMGDIWSEHLKRDTISIHDDFFGLGGYSILAIRMLTPLRKAIGPGISLTTFFDHPSIAEQAELVVQASMMRSGISTHQELRQRLFNTFDEESITDSAQEITLGDIRNLNLESRIKLENDLLVKQQEMVPVDDPIPSRPNSELSPLSFAQQRIWFLEELSPDTTMYNTGDAVRLTGDLDINALEKALIQVVQRHEILRLQIQVVNGEPFQSFRDEPGIQLQRKNFENLAEDQKEQHLNQVILTILRTSYDLKKEPLIRAAVVKMGPEEHIFILGHHHLVTDGWSSRVIFGDIRVLYNNLITGKNTELPALSIQYADFAVWQRNQLTEDRVSSESDYWIQRLRGVPTLLDLPTDLPRPKIQSHRGHRQYFELSKEDFSIVEDFSCRLHVSPFVTLSAAFASILYRYSQQEDFLIGLPFADRDRPELQNLAGLMLDTHLIRFSFSNETTFTELIHRTRSEISETYSHRDLPFELVVDAVQPERSLGHMPLCQVTVTWREFDSRLESLELEGLKTENILPHDKTAKFDISVIFSEKPQGVTFEVEYNTDLFASPTIERMAGHFKRLLMVAVSDPGMPISELSLLKEEEQQNQLKDWNATKVDFGREYCIHELFEKQVGRSPHAVAVEFKHRQLSYEELNRRANRLAHYLADLGLGQEAPVGICMERSFDMMVALLAVLKAGGAYVPLDPFYPNNRLAFMLEDSGAQVILTQSGLRDHLPENQIRTLCLDTERFESYPSDNLTAPSPESLAYILYTSGSTGKPKGVMMEHRALANHMHWMQRQFPLSPADKVLQKTSISFDASVWELFAPLLCGARLVLALPASHRSPTELLQEVKHNRITILQLVPTMLEAMADKMDAQHCSSLRRLYCGGEVLNADLVRHIHEKLPVEIVNLYGPTEACIDATAYVCNSDSPIQKVPIGRPISNLRAYILDRNGGQVPAGIPGELHLAGAGLARGYWNQADLTAEKFVFLNLVSNVSERVYRTGDLVRYLPDGNIEFLGRIDDQVKVRGYRIELGEIEAALCDHEVISRAAVVVYQDPQGEEQLAAYIIPNDPGFRDTGVLRDYLGQRLPSYMLPAAYVMLDEFPRTPSGKLDRRGLPVPEFKQLVSENHYESPRNAIEAQIAEVWCEVLKQKRVSIHDNFFTLGGHSLKAVQIIARLSQRFELEIPLPRIFEAPTVAKLAQDLQKIMKPVEITEISKLGKILRPDKLPLSFAQQRMWFLDRFLPDKAIYNMPYALRLKGPLNPDALARSLHQLIDRHEALRTRFELQGDDPVQIIEDTPDQILKIISLDDLPEVEQLNRLKELTREDGQKPFDLAAEIPFRAKLYILSPEDHLLQITMHHIASDGWSSGIMLHELNSSYNACVNGQDPSLPPLNVQYADYTIWQRAWLQGEVLEKQLTYWKEQLSDLATLELPTDHPRPSISSNEGDRLSLLIPQFLVDKIQAIARRSGATLFMTLLAAFKVLMHRYSGQDDIAIGSPIAGRNERKLEDIIGFFVNTLVLRDDLSGNPKFTDLVKRVRNTALDAYDHPDIPFEKLVEELAPERDLSRNPLFQVMFILQNAPSTKLAFQDVEYTRFSVEKPSAKFDLKLAMTSEEAGLRAGWEFSTDLFDKETVQRMAEHYITLLESIAANPEQTIGSLPMLSEPETYQQLEKWNNPEVYQGNQSMHALFEKQVADNPEMKAISCSGENLTYRELNEQANRLAHYLTSLEVTPATRVGVCLERSVDLVITLLGILKAGGVYVPLDPGYPSERLAYMLKDATAPVLITKEALRERVAEFEGRIVNLDSERDTIRSMDKNNPEISVSAASPAYVIYTSGSTGTPKGMELPHSTLVNLMVNGESETSGGRVAQFTSISFDVSLQEIFFALTSGSTLVVLDDEIRVKPEAFVRFLKEELITDLLVPDTVLQYVLQAVNDSDIILPALRNIYQAGEPLSVTPVVRAFFNAHRECRLHNHYGPAESHVVTTHPLTGNSDLWPKKPSIGKPVPNVQVYLLDQYRNLLPPGVPGEIYIAGNCLATGYLNLAELTQDKFVPNPFARHADAKMYRTGDLARYLKDGSIDFIGRADHQVKIRGFRIEPGEIESLLSSHAAVKQAVVLPREEGPGDLRLVAYLIFNNKDFNDFDSLRNWLKERLPDYMIPAAFVTLEAFPLTSNGKLNRRALPEPDYNQFSTADEDETPLSPVEAAIAEAWCEVLNLEKVGANDNFFALGGHSLSAIRVNARLSEKFNIDMSLRQFFESPTVAELAVIVEKML